MARRLHLGSGHMAPRLSLPGKLVFPSSHTSGHFSMLGLGDIVMPGLLLCFVMRYDAYKKAQVFTVLFVLIWLLRICWFFSKSENVSLEIKVKPTFYCSLIFMAYYIVSLYWIKNLVLDKAWFNCYLFRKVLFSRQRQCHVHDTISLKC